MGMSDSKLMVTGQPTATNAILPQSVVGVAGTAILSINSVDANPSGQGNDWGEGAPIFLKWVVVAAITGATGLTINVISDSNANLTTTPVVVASVALSGANLAAGAFGFIPVPPTMNTLAQEFWGASFAPTGANSTAGSVIAEFTISVDDPKKINAVKSGFAIA